MARLSLYTMQITNKYVEFLRKLLNKKAPIFELFEGEPSEKKRETLLKVLQYISTSCKCLDKMGVKCDMHDYLAELLLGLDYYVKNLITTQSLDDDAINLVRQANLLVTKIGNFIYQGYIVENDKGNLSVPKLFLSDINVKNMRDIISQNVYNLPEAIICADGKVYPAKGIHDNLVQFLIANNVDLKDAIRVDAIEIGNHVRGNKRDGRIIFSSLEQFGYMWDELNHDKAVWLTPEQADSMYMFFLAVKQCYPEMKCSFKDVLLASENLGWQTEGNDRRCLIYYNNNVTKENLELLSDSVAKMFDENDRRRPDLDVFNLSEELIRQNNIRRSILISKNPLKVIGQKDESYSSDI